MLTELSAVCCLVLLQITELLGEVKVKKTGTSSLLDDFLHSLKEVLMGLPSSNQIDVSQKPSVTLKCLGSQIPVIHSTKSCTLIL